MRQLDAEFPYGPLTRPGTRVQRMPVQDGRVVSYYFPGRWMEDAEFSVLRAEVEDLARERLGSLPGYGVFLPGRAPFENRIVTLLYRGDELKPIALSAIVHCPVVIGGKTHDVINLGLAISRRNAASNGPLLPLYLRPLYHYYVGRLFRPFWIATFTQKPNAFGAIADAFGDVYPHYRPGASASPLHVAVARQVFERWRGESGVGPDGAFDEQRFVVRASCAGPSAVLRQDFERLPKYRIPEANEYCRRALDYARGDELLMVGRVDTRTAWRALVRHLTTRR